LINNKQCANKKFYETFSSTFAATDVFKTVKQCR